MAIRIQWNPSDDDIRKIKEASKQWEQYTQSAVGQADAFLIRLYIKQRFEQSLYDYFKDSALPPATNESADDEKE